MGGFERISIDGRKGKDAGLRPSVVRLRDGVEFFLTRGVPQHQSYIFAVNSAKTYKKIKDKIVLHIIFYFKEMTNGVLGLRGRILSLRRRI